MPLIGCSGIMTAEDALEFIMAGAAAIQVGTANLINCRALMEIIEGIKAHMQKEGIADIKEFTLKSNSIIVL